MSFHSRSRQTEKSDASRSLGSDEKIMSILPDSDSNPLVSSQHQRIYSLAIPKRRSAVSHLTPKNRTRSLGANVLQDTESCTSQNDLVGTSTPEVKSKFTELFNFRKREYEDSNDSTRKVSIGWMTEGKRCGYGYSFVKGEEPDKTTTKTNPASNSPCKSTNNDKKASAQTYATKDVDQIINIKVQAKEAVKLAAENQETYSKRHSRLPKFVSNPKAETN
ncbi:hypothetical protein BGW36DRAFT_378150 [Talaromyces proteolyticus]|uniref:Uncharacterized protein n=1 Tax=Talaromyces proteolyticus TaxID=1131652 RepID=A0AAD4KS55_9EURO|nr:uncharacterized protein BGW36DRAFT_378150 [Talaromyces proteolyticus]KAH8697182.1 hypothetical protein BGW36DRAFT_378150 [Talaromyces proteolyticus]